MCTRHCMSPQLCWAHSLLSRSRGPRKKWEPANGTRPINRGVLLNNCQGGTLDPHHSASPQMTCSSWDGLPFVRSLFPSSRGLGWEVRLDRRDDVGKELVLVIISESEDQKTRENSLSTM